MHVARNAVVKVAVGPATGHRMAHILRAGDVVPDGVEPELLEQLAKRGLIEKVADPDDEPAAEDKPKRASTGRKSAAEKAAEAAQAEAAKVAEAEAQKAADAAASGAQGDAGTPPQQ